MVQLCRPVLDEEQGRGCAFRRHQDQEALAIGHNLERVAQGEGVLDGKQRLRISAGEVVTLGLHLYGAPTLGYAPFNGQDAAETEARPLPSMARSPGSAGDMDRGSADPG